MSSPLLSWIEPDRLQSAFARLRGPARKGDTGSHGGEAAAEQVVPPPLVVAPPPPVGVAPPPLAGGFQPPPGRMRQRIEALGEWVQQQTGASAVCIIDREGLMLLDRGSGDEVAAIASAFVSLIKRVRSSTENEIGGLVILGLANGKLLHMIEVDTSLGEFAACFVVTGQLRPELATAIGDGLRLAIEGDQESLDDTAAVRGLAPPWKAT
ncbi:MAG TPA: hypothetical protein VGV61_14335 [Thermoanaerobaculia bacterium]|nr:hypothetical protein [Thermoanaerobaculia bacterium]